MWTLVTHRQIAEIAEQLYVRYEPIFYANIVYIKYKFNYKIMKYTKINLLR